jgi:peptide/nickel transport system permease protein
VIAYFLRRCVIALNLVFVVVTLIFLLLHMIPGDPAEMLLSGGGTSPPPEAVTELRSRMGLDQPLFTQYRDYLVRLLHLDLGSSFSDDASVSAEIAIRLPRTLELIAAATALALLFGLPLGVIVAMKRNTVVDQILTFGASLALSIPVFITGTLMILIFAQTMRVLPAGGFTEFSVSPIKHLINLAMPAAAIAFGLGAVIMRMTRSSVLDAIERDWVRTARAKGLSRPAVLAWHVVRNALTPIMTVLGLHMGTLLGGTVLIEFVFGWPGLSSLLVRAVEQRDYPEVQGIVLVISLLFILLNLAFDLLYSCLDPRIRHG